MMKMNIKQFLFHSQKIRAEGPLKTKCRLIPGGLIDKLLVFFFKDEDPLLQSVIVY